MCYDRRRAEACVDESAQRRFRLLKAIYGTRRNEKETPLALEISTKIRAIKRWGRGGRQPAFGRQLASRL